MTLERYTKRYEWHSEGSAKAIKFHQPNESRRPISLDEFANKIGQDYRTAWPGPIDPRLRQAVQMSAISIPVGFLTSLFSQAGVELRHSPDYF